MNTAARHLMRRPHGGLAKTTESRSLGREVGARSGRPPRCRGLAHLPSERACSGGGHPRAAAAPRHGPAAQQVHISSRPGRTSQPCSGFPLIVRFLDAADDNYIGLAGTLVSPKQPFLPPALDRCHARPMRDRNGPPGRRRARGRVHRDTVYPA